jgi:hypothetical protein
MYLEFGKISNVTIFDAFQSIENIWDGWALQLTMIYLIICAVAGLLFISTLIIILVLMYYHSPIDQGTFGDMALLGWDFRPDLCEGGIEYKGEMDEVDIVLQRVKERRLRKMKGLPPGASLSGQGLELYTIKRANHTVTEVGSDSEGEDFPLLD